MAGQTFFFQQLSFEEISLDTSANSIFRITAIHRNRIEAIGIRARVRLFVLPSFREDDARGKHTTTRRELFLCDNGVAIIDTPGMRELQLYDTEQGIDRTFRSILELSQECRYANCGHVSEPDCAIQAAIADGSITQAHFDNYCKLLKEEESQKRRAEGAHAIKAHYRQYFKKIHSENKDQW